MFTKKSFTIISISLALIASGIAGCAPKKNEKTPLRGRLSRGQPANSLVDGRPTGYASVNTFSGIYGDANFQMAVAALVQGSGEAPGYVPEQPTNGMGVLFWVDQLPNINTGYFNTGRLHIEVWDQLAGQVGSDGQKIPPFVVHIGADQEGFQGVSGQNSGGQVNLTFSSLYHQITLQGYIQGNQFVGQMSFTNLYGQSMSLGQFQVATCNFFRCQ